MASENIVTYFQENKSTYSQEILIQKLREAGYREEDIQEGVRFVYFGLSGVSAAVLSRKGKNFFGFKNTRVYSTTGEKIRDFLFGLIAIPLVFSILFGLLGVDSLFRPSYDYNYRYRQGYYFSTGSILSLLVEIGLVFYLWKRRRFIAYGVIFPLIFSFLRVAGMVFGTGYYF